MDKRGKIMVIYSFLNRKPIVPSPGWDFRVNPFLTTIIITYHNQSTAVKTQVLFSEA